MRSKRILLGIVLVFVLSAAAWGSLRYYPGYQKAKQERLWKASWLELQQGVQSEIARFKGEPGVVIKDLRTGWELTYNKDTFFPSASLAKIPLMAACFLGAEQGRIKLDRVIALQSVDKLTGSGVLKDMPAGSTFTIDKLIGLMVYDSDNTATNMVTNVLGMDYLNRAFKDFGLKDTALSRKIADYQLRDRGIENYTTAQDMAFLLEKMYAKELGSRYVSDQCIRLLKLTRTNDRIPKYLPPEITIAHKTGLENGVCHDTGIVFTRQGDFVIVVLTKHANPNSVPSKEFIAKIAWLTHNYFEQSGKKSSKK